jgi:hypothetical protein
MTGSSEGTRVKALWSRKSCRSRSRQKQMDFGSLAGLASQLEPAAKTVRDHVVNDMEAKTRTALIAARCEEWVERVASDVGTHTAAVVGKKNFDTVVPERPHLYGDGASVVFRKRVSDRVQEQVG